MLKKFLLNSLSSFVGAWIAIFLFLLGLFFLIFGLIGSAVTKETPKISSHSVMHIKLAGSIVENESAPQIDMSVLISGKLEQPQTLQGLLGALENAKHNNDIEAILVECQGVSAAPATLNALREGILDFKKSGKRVFAYGDFLSMGDYFVSTSADEIYLNPAGTLNLQGINGVGLYFKDLLDKIGVQVQTVRVGSFKSAIEPYTSNEMSQAARLQLDSLYTEMWDFILDKISTKTEVPVARIDSLVNSFLFLDEASSVKSRHLVSDNLYYRQVLQKVADYVGKDVSTLNLVSPSLVYGNPAFNPNASNQIAVLYAVGEIGEFEGAGINCHTLVPLIVKLAEDDNVKGMVLRVNSPGGSVFGSDQIGEALDYFQSKGKPLAVSMGGYAASGGYWISAGADYIFADPLTITGSIGIFGMVPNIGGLAEKVGVHPQSVGTNPDALFPAIFYPMSEAQEAALQANVERGYEKFISRVANGRKKSTDYIKSIAEGRVWNAIKAKDLGLVDSLGGLDDAVKWVSERLQLDNYNVVPYPFPEFNFLNMLLATTAAKSPVVSKILERMKEPEFDRQMLTFVAWLINLERVQARSPFYFFTL